MPVCDGIESHAAGVDPGSPVIPIGLALARRQLAEAAAALRTEIDRDLGLELARRLASR